MSRPVPIMLVHGFNGSAEDWEGAAFRDYLIERGADPDLLRVFHYGWRAREESATGDGDELRDRIYNNQADIRRIASRLTYRETDDPNALCSQLVRLSQASVARGGPERVTIVAHSMGGLVARYYLSRRVPDEWGTVNEGVVGRLITIATPHLGVKLAHVVPLVPESAFIWRLLNWLERLLPPGYRPFAELAQLDAQVRAMQRNAQAELMPVASQGYLDSPAVRQMVPGSDFLTDLNRLESWPDDIESAVLWGDVQISASVRWARLALWERTVSFGDLLISAESARTMPAPDTQRFPFIWRYEYEVQLREPAVAPFDLSSYLPPVSHSNLLGKREVHQTVARLVGLS